MSEDDFDPFVQALDDFATLRQLPPLEPRAKALFFRAVARYPLDLVLRAIEAHLVDPEEGKYRTMIQPAHVVAQIEGAAGRDGRPEADEAWAIALRAQDEATTVIWTEEIAQAMGAAQSVLARGDEVGARVAFRAAYNRLVADARAAGQVVRWSVSLGTDPAQREFAITRALEQHLLPPPLAAALLPRPGDGPPVDVAVAEANLARIRAMLAGALSPAGRRREGAEQASQVERDRLEHLKAESAAKMFQHPVSDS